MKKILFLLLLFFVFIPSIYAKEYGKWTLKDENMHKDALIEYRYRFYKEEKNGKYLTYDDIKVNDYKYVDKDNLKYSSYSNWQDSCLVDTKRYQVENKSLYVYQKVLPIRFIMIDKIDDLHNILDIKIYNKDKLVNYKFLECANCVNSFKDNLENKIIKLQLDELIDSDNLSIFVSFEVNTNYRLTASNDASFNKIALQKEVSGKDITYLFDKDWLENTTYGDNFYSENEINSDFVKQIGMEDKCRYKEFKMFYYNLDKVYYDDNYYTNVDGYIKDLDDYKIYYSNPINTNTTNSLLVSNTSSREVKKDNKKTSLVNNKKEEKKEDISKTKADKDSDKKQDKSVEKDSKLVNTLHISDSKNIIKYIILIVIGLTIIYIIYINRSEVKNK